MTALFVRSNRLTKFTRCNLALSVYPPGSAALRIRGDTLYSDGVVRRAVLVGKGGWDICIRGCGTDINPILRSREVQRLPSFPQCNACL